MRKLLMTMVLVLFFAIPARALEMEAPLVPESGAQFMPSEPENLGQAILELLRDALLYFRPNLQEAASVCTSIMGTVMIISVIRSFPGASLRAVNLAGTVVICVVLLSSANAMVNLSADTVREVSEYGKLLLPVMTAALAAQGSVTASSALYAGTAFFGSLLSDLISKLLIPMIYLFLALAAAKSAVGEELLKKLAEQMKGIMTWLLKTVLYIYTGFITITGVISGTTDAAALKAAKLTISGAVPVVGGILSDASEAVLISAGTLKNSAGLYGMFAILAIWIGPFVQIGVHYLILKVTGAVCGVFGSKETMDLIADFAAAMGLLLAMTGTVCLTLLIGVVCFMKGAI